MVNHRSGYAMQKFVICAKDSRLNDIFCSDLIGISRADGQCVGEASQKFGSLSTRERCYFHNHPIKPIALANSK